MDIFSDSVACYLQMRNKRRRQTFFLPNKLKLWKLSENSNNNNVKFEVDKSEFETLNTFEDFLD